MLGNPSLQALVTVRHSGADGVLDVYVYNNITGPKPEQIFKLEGLIRGVARISGYNLGQETWKNDPAQVAQKLAAKLFDWKRKACRRMECPSLLPRTAIA